MMCAFSSPIKLQRSLGGLFAGLAALSLGVASAQSRPEPGQRRESVDRAPAAAADRAPAPTFAPGIERAQPIRATERAQPTRSSEQPQGRPGRIEAPKATPQSDAKRTPNSAVPGSASATGRSASEAIINPRPLPRWTVPPTSDQWQHRDIMAEIQAMSRRGFIRVNPIGEGVDAFSGVSEWPAGWKAYGFLVPAGEKLHVRLTHSHEGWFRLMMVGKWGQVEKGMLQNLIPTGNAEASYINYSDQPRSVYVIVDDPGWMSSIENPFKVKIERSWDPAKKALDGVNFSTGIWAMKEATAPDAVSEAKAEG